MSRASNFIDRIKNDKKSHIILGLMVNPIIIHINSKVFASIITNTFLLLLLAVVFCFLFHLAIEFYQKITKSGQFELWDAAAGTSSAIPYALAIALTGALIL